MENNLKFIPIGKPKEDGSGLYSVKCNKESMTLSEFVNLVSNNDLIKTGRIHVSKFNDNFGQYVKITILKFERGKGIVDFTEQMDWSDYMRKINFTKLNFNFDNYYGCSNAIFDIRLK